jgi:hypothetical protein
MPPAALLATLVAVEVVLIREDRGPSDELSGDSERLRVATGRLSRKDIEARREDRLDPPQP